MKKSVLLFISLFPFSVLASSASINTPDRAQTVSVNSSSFKSELIKGSMFSEIDSSEISLNIPAGLSVDAYPSIGFSGESVNYSPGEYADLLNIQSIKVKEEIKTPPSEDSENDQAIPNLATLTLRINEGEEVDPSLCLEVDYLKLVSETPQDPLFLGSVCAGEEKTFFKQLPPDLTEGDGYALYLYKGDGREADDMKGTASMVYKDSEMRLQTYWGMGRSELYYDRVGLLSISYQKKSLWN